LQTRKKRKAGVILSLPHSVRKIQADFLSKLLHFSRLPPLFLSKPPDPAQNPLHSYAQDTRLRVYTRLRTQRICHFCLHQFGIVFRHFKEGASGQEVDATNFHFTLDIAIDEIDDFAGEEVVALTEVEEKARVTLFRHGVALRVAVAFVVTLVAAVAFVLADAICTQFHADTMTDLMASLAAYRARIDSRWQDV